jgi:hypothetical protein
MAVPNRAMEPLSGLRMPAMVEISVVFPQPEGPTSKVICPE